jgi:hypothetical protein
MAEQKGEVSQERIEPEWDRQNRTGRKTARTGLPGKEYQDRTARTGLLE